MNKKALLYGLAYSVLVIAIKLIILFGGYSLSKFGYYYSTLTCVLLIIPFYFVALKNIRDKDYNGVISGRDAVRLAMTIFGISAVIISVYNYYEFEYSGKFLAIEYYNSQQFLDYLKAQTKIKAEDYSKIIAEQIKNSEASAFKATTGKLFSSMLIGLSSAVIVGSIMKRNPKN